MWKLQGRIYTDSELIQSVHFFIINFFFFFKLIINLLLKVLQIEQLHTSGGGWQDQVASIINGGFKLSSINLLNKNVNWDIISISPKFLNMFNQRLVLIYTGTTRLAKNVLQVLLFLYNLIILTIFNIKKNLFKIMFS